MQRKTDATSRPVVHVFGRGEDRMVFVVGAGNELVEAFAESTPRTDCRVMFFADDVDVIDHG